ncbi:hypothetical protein GWK47_007023 [Chionoecetes opilio]|uniref:Uncharacterized protein n=1 Tax=Chionoecetes opilio TaxID=41210 RepID=A0A8J5CF72_CHIOP|nr:hypothetical protein GWK47_007023 [Chionoecetes opilio]
MVELESSSSESSSPANAANTSTSSSDAGVASPPKRLRTRGTKSVLSPDLVGALDRTGVSSRQALRIVAATASSLGHDPQELVLNPESFRQARAKYRSTLAKDIKETFSPLTPLTVHWDGKILPQDDGTHAKRLAILVTGEGVEKLLGVPELHSGTGDVAATAVFEALEDWGVQERFATEIYVLRWFKSTVPSYAPANDLGFAKDIVQYHDESIRKACFTTLSRHFWYLSEDLIGLSLFDSRLPVSDKQAIVQAILYDEGAEEPAKRINLPSSQVPAATLPSFATKNSLRLFEALDIKTDFLSTNPRKWQEEESYVEACRRIEGLRVVNDTAKRGVALIQSFNLRLTKDEEQRQFLLQVVEAHRHQQPGTSKASLPRPSRPQ